MVGSSLFQNKTLVKALTLFLLFGSAVLALYDIEACLNIFTFLFTSFSNDAKLGTALAAPLTLVLGFLALAFIIFTAEYHSRHFGTQASRKLMLYSLGTELVLFIIGYVILGNI